jgi:hypothetical protein
MREAQDAKEEPEKASEAPEPEKTQDADEPSS